MSGKSKIEWMITTGMTVKWINDPENCGMVIRVKGEYAEVYFLSGDLRVVLVRELEEMK